MLKSVLFFLSVSFSFGVFAQSEPQEIILPMSQTNWVSLDYLNCLKAQLPCECEKSGEVFLIDLDTSGMYLRLYNGRANQDYGGGNLDAFGFNSYYVLNYQTDEILSNTITDTLGVVSIDSRTLSYIDSNDRETIFVKYGDSNFFPYMDGNVTWLNEQLFIRGYSSLQEILHVDPLNCFCNWELGAINLLSSGKKQWILEMENNELIIYRWVNPPKRKSIGELKIKKKEIQRLKW